MKRISWLSTLILWILSACAPGVIIPSAAATLTATQPPTATQTQAPTATPPPTLSPTPDPFFQYTVEHLRSRTYGGGQIEFLEVMAQNLLFTRYLFRYPSDGLNIYGFANIPNDGGPYPVVIALHGYIDPAIYNTLDYTTHYADAISNAGYIVLHPNLRGYRPSDEGENLYRVGMAIDVLNLIAMLQTPKGGLQGRADPDRIGLWGHSMGGGISTRVLTVSDDVDAAVLYGAMSGDEQKNFEAIWGWSGNTRGLEELSTPPDALERISPMYFFQDITAAVSIHHGAADALVPPDWSVMTCEQLTALGLNVECTYYDGMPHTFYGQGDEQFIQNTLEFFNRYLAMP